MGTTAGYLGKVTNGSTTIAEMGRWSITGQEIEMLEDTEFTDEFKSYKPGTSDGGIVTFDGNYDADNSAQDVLVSAWETKAATIVDLRFYFGDGTNDFYYAPYSVLFKMISLELGVDKSGLGTIAFSVKVINGFLRDATAAFASTASNKINLAGDPANTITKASGTAFGTLGFVNGQTLTMRGTTEDDGDYTISNVADDVITVSTAIHTEADIVDCRLVAKT